MLSEKRFSTRRMFHGIVQVHDLRTPPVAFRPSKSNTVHLKAINICKDGICLQTDFFLIPNHLFQLDFEYGNKPVHAVARVVWSQRNSCGMQFVRPEDMAGVLPEDGQEFL